MDVIHTLEERYPLNLSLFLFLNSLFFRAVLGLQQNCTEGAEISHILPVLLSLPHYQHSPPEWYICYNW